MGIAINKNSMNGLAMDNKKVSGMAYKGDIIFSSNSIRTFADATDEEIAAMLEAHYSGLINIEDYWSIGDTRKIHINAIPADSYCERDYIEEDNELVIIGFNHDDLTNKQGKRTKAAITVNFKNVYGCNVPYETIYYWGSDSVYADSSTGNWNKNPMKYWLNNIFINALPINFLSLIKTVNKQNLKSHTSNATFITNDKIFWLSYTEVFGNEKHNHYCNLTDGEGPQYKYYETSANRIKYHTDNKNNKRAWWLRSPSTWAKNDDYYWFAVGSSGTSYYCLSHNVNMLQAPAFCL